VGRAALPGMLRAWARLTHARLDAELTRVVLEARRSPPPSPRALVPSAVCPRLTWVATAADGHVTIAADPAEPLVHPSARPWRFTLSGP